MVTKRRKILRIIRIVVYVLIIISILLLKYTDVIRVRCYIHDKLGVLCPTCGMTRGMRAIANFDIARATQLNAYGTLILFPIFLILFIDDIICMILKKKSFVEIILGE